MAATLVNSGRPVLAVLGDYGFMMNSQALETAMRLGLDMTVLILNDAAYGMIRWKQTDMGFPNFGLSHGNPNFVAYTRSYGAEGHRIAFASGLTPMLERCLGAAGVHVIDCPVDYTENDRILHHEIEERSAAV